MELSPFIMEMEVTDTYCSLHWFIFWTQSFRSLLFFSLILLTHLFVQAVVYPISTLNIWQVHLFTNICHLGQDTCGDISKLQTANMVAPNSQHGCTGVMLHRRQEPATITWCLKLIHATILLISQTWIQKKRAARHVIAHMCYYVQSGPVIKCTNFFWQLSILQ